MATTPSKPSYLTLEVGVRIQAQVPRHNGATNNKPIPPSKPSYLTLEVGGEDSQPESFLSLALNRWRTRRPTRRLLERKGKCCVSAR